MPLQVKNKTKATTTTTEKEVKQEVAEKTEAVVTAEKEVNATNEKIEYGQDSDKLEFVCCLGDPSRDDVTTDDKGGKRHDPTIVGYRFKAKIDLEVPDVMPGDLKDNLMSFTGDPMKTRMVKAGENIDLTKFETGLLISQERFNALASGGNITVRCAYSKSTKKSSDGKPIKTTAAAQIPTVSLRGIGTSVKDIPMEEVLTFTKEQSANGIVKKTRTIKPGFEKFISLCEEKVRRSSGGSGSNGGNKNERVKGAEAFLQIVRAKKA